MESLNIFRVNGNGLSEEKIRSMHVVTVEVTEAHIAKQIGAEFGHLLAFRLSCSIKIGRIQDLQSFRVFPNCLYIVFLLKKCVSSIFKLNGLIQFLFE